MGIGAIKPRIYISSDYILPYIQYRYGIESIHELLSNLLDRAIHEPSYWRYYNIVFKKFVANNNDIFIYNNDAMIVFNFNSFKDYCCKDDTLFTFGNIVFKMSSLSTPILKSKGRVYVDIYDDIPNYPCQKISKILLFSERIDALYE